MVSKGKDLCAIRIDSNDYPVWDLFEFPESQHLRQLDEYPKEQETSS